MMTYAVYLKNTETRLNVFQHAVLDEPGLKEFLVNILAVREDDVKNLLQQFEESGQNTLKTDLLGHPYSLTVVRADRGL